MNVNLTQDEVTDIRLALMYYSSHWLTMVEAARKGKTGNVTVENAQLCYDDVRRLQDRFINLSTETV